MHHVLFVDTTYTCWGVSHLRLPDRNNYISSPQSVHNYVVTPECIMSCQHVRGVISRRKSFPLMGSLIENETNIYMRGVPFLLSSLSCQNVFNPSIIIMRENFTALGITLSLGLKQLLVRQRVLYGSCIDFHLWVQLRWAGYIARMGEGRSAFKSYIIK